MAKGWKQVKVNVELSSPTLGDLQRLARALMESGWDLTHLSLENYGLICLLHSLMLDERKAALPIFPVAKSKQRKKKKVDSAL